MNYLYLIASCLLGFASMSSAGGLSFEKNRIDVTVAADAKKVIVPFKFENKTNKPVTIARYDTACACLKSKVKGGKMTYAPGEKGEMELYFDLGKFSGTVNKSLMLWTTDDAAEKPSAILTSYITIPVLFEISPVTTTWESDGRNTQKTIKLRVKDKKPMHIKKCKGTNPNFDYELITVRDGWEYELKVTPKNMSKPAFGIFKIQTDSKIARYKNMMSYAVVKKPK